MKHNHFRLLFSWNRSSLIILSTFILLILVIAYVWWPLLQDYLGSYQPNMPFWMQTDWLLIIIFLFMSIMIMLNADLRRDTPMALIALAGGFVIEFWGTRTGLWHYYTGEQPPLWIIPAWPIAFLTVNRLAGFVNALIPWRTQKTINFSYWAIFSSFFAYFLYYAYPFVSKMLTILAILLCAIIIITFKDKRKAIFYFIAGSALGYFLELWGTTRECWTYYSGGYPPLFTVFAHGFAVVAVIYFYDFFIQLQSTLFLHRTSK